MAKSPATVKNPYKTMFKGTSFKKNKFHRPEGAGNFDNMDDYNIVKSIATQEIASGATVLGDIEILGTLSGGNIAAGGGGTGLWFSGANFIQPLSTNQVISGAGLIIRDTISGGSIFSGANAVLTTLHAANADAHHPQIHNITTHTCAENWSINYCNASDMVTLVFGDDSGKYLRSNGEAALTWETPPDTTDHTALSNIGTLTHAQLETELTSVSGATTGNASTINIVSGAVVDNAATIDTVSGAVVAHEVEYQNLSGAFTDLSGGYRTDVDPGHTHTGGAAGSNNWFSGANFISPKSTNQIISGAAFISRDIISGSSMYLTTKIAAENLSGSNLNHLSGAVIAHETEYQNLSGAFTHLSGAHYSLSGAVNTHIADSSDPHGATLVQSSITSSGEISGAQVYCADHNGQTISGAAVNVLWGVSATPPTANTQTLGSIYLQYTP